MATRLSKVLVVFIAFASVVLLAVAVAIRAGGPNWTAIADSLEGYQFSLSVGENPQWTVVRGRDNKSIGSSPVLPEVIVAVLDQELQDQQAELAQLQERQTFLEGRIGVFRQSIQQDRQLLAERVEEYRRDIAAIHEQIATASQQVLETAEQVQAVEDEIVSRRDDVLRLQAELAAVQTDVFRSQQIQQQLEDLIAQIDADLAKLQRRRDQLQANLGTSETN